MSSEFAQQDTDQLRVLIQSAIECKKPLTQDFNTDLSLFGFKNPDDLEQFLLSPTGKIVEVEIEIKEAEIERIIEAQKTAIQEAEIQKLVVKIHLLLWLISQEKEAEAKQRLTEECNKKLIDAAKGTENSTLDDAQKDLQRAIKTFDSDMKNFETQLYALEQNEVKINTQLDDLKQRIERLKEKEKAYTSTLENFEKDTSDYYKLEPQQLDALIKQIEAQVEQKTEQVMSALDNDEERKAYSIQAEQVALALKLESLYDLRKVLDGKKIIQENSIYYLIDRALDFHTLSQDEKIKAASAFLGKEPELTAVKKMVKESLKLEKEFHGTQAAELRTKKTNNDNEKIQLSNKINLMRAFKARINELKTNLQNIPSLTAMRSGKKLVLSSIPSGTMKAYLLIFSSAKYTVPNLSLDNLLKYLKKQNLTNKVNAIGCHDCIKQLLVMLGQGTIPSMAPLPVTTMESLLKYMAAFGADPYKVTIEPSPMQSPRDTQQHTSTPPIQEKEIHTPFTPLPTNPYPEK